jgi:hypothetical protein
MAYKTEIDRCADEIEKAREQVKASMIAYSKGGSIDALNKANRALADAHQASWRHASGIARDDR